MNLDTIGYNIVSKYLISDNLIPIVRIVTNMGGEVVLIGLTLILLIVIKDKNIGKIICLNLALSTILNYILKSIIRRPRPTQNRLIDISGYSFPSGHSMISFAFYGLLIYLIYKYIKNKYIKYFSIIALSLLILCIGISRIYLGVHYTTDVLGGYLIGIIYIHTFIKVWNRSLVKDE